MLGQALLAAVLVAFVTSQTTSNGQSSQGGFLLDGRQTSWATQPSSPNDHVSLEFANGMNLDSSSSSLFENQDSMAGLGVSNGQFQDFPYDRDTRYDPFDQGMADGSRMDMLGSESLLNQNLGDLLDQRNAQSSSLGDSQFLRGSTSDGTSSVLDGNLLGEDLSGFRGRRYPEDMSQGARSRGRFPFSSSNVQSMFDGNRGLGMRRGMPWRNFNSDSETGLTSQLGLGRGLMGRSLGLRRGPLGVSDGQLNLLRDLEGDRSRNSLWRTGVESGSQLGSRLGNDELIISGRRLGNAMRYNPFGRMSNPSLGLGPRSPYASSSSSFNLGQLSPLGRSSSQGWRTTNIGGRPRLTPRLGRSSLMSNLDSSPLSTSLGRTLSTSNLGQTLPLGPRSSRLTMYPTGTRSQMSGRMQGQGRRNSF